MNDPDRIVAVGLLSAQDLERLGHGFERAYPVGGDDAFGELVRALDAITWSPEAEEAEAGKPTG